MSNRPDDVPESYQRYLVHGFREAWPFTGSPLRLKFTRAGLEAVMAALPWLLASYLLGAIPTSYLAARLFRGIDLREHGSRNLGATNLYRVLGWRYAVPVGLFDAAKGARAGAGVRAAGDRSSSCSRWSAGSWRCVGHVFSVFVGFKGGKGVATAAGVMLGLTPGRARGGGRWCGSCWSAHRLRLGRQHRGGGDLPARRASCSTRRSDPAILWLDIARRGRHRLAAPGQHPAAAQREPRTASAAARRRAPPRVSAIAVLGAGSWGTTLANLLAGKGERGPALGLRAGGGRGDQPARTRTRSSCPACRWRRRSARVGDPRGGGGRRRA